MSISMEVPDIHGAAADAGYFGWLPIEKIAFGATRGVTSPTGRRGGREASNTELQELILRRTSDRATPALVLGACCGRGQTIRIHLTRTGDGAGAEPFAEYVLHNALISEYAVRARSRGHARPVETLRISFTAWELKYVGQDADGRVLPPQVVGFDSTNNRRI